VIQGFSACEGGFHIYAQILLYLALANIFRQLRRAHRQFKLPLVLIKWPIAYFDWFLVR
jgi:hypothetical protein